MRGQIARRGDEDVRAGRRPAQALVLAHRRSRSVRSPPGPWRPPSATLLHELGRHRRMEERLGLRARARRIASIRPPSA